MTDNSARRDVCLLAFPFFFSRMGKLLQREKRKTTPQQKRIDPHRLEDWKICCIMQHTDGESGVVEWSRPVSAQHISTTDTISPPPNRTHHVNRMNGDESTFPILAAAEFTMMKIQWIIKTLQTSLMGELEGKSIVLPQTFLVDEWWDWWPCKKIIIVPSSSQFKIPPFRFFFLFFILLWRYWSKAKTYYTEGKSQLREYNTKKQGIFQAKNSRLLWITFIPSTTGGGRISQNEWNETRSDLSKTATKRIALISGSELKPQNLI